jgi:hypothetical protein
MKVNVLMLTVFVLSRSLAFSQENKTSKTDSLLTVFSNPKLNSNKSLALIPKETKTFLNGNNKTRFGNMPCYKANMSEVEKMPVAKPNESITYKMPVAEEKYFDKLPNITGKWRIINGKMEKINEDY